MPAWEDRFNDYTDTRASIDKVNEMPLYTKQQWQDWCQVWDTYVKSGGVRPPNRPPV